MERDKAYTGIDSFRMIAALLVIAIHTSPLTSVNNTADFVLTRIVARVAVPFFLMTSGFFLFSETDGSVISFSRLIAFIKKTALIYAAAVLLYLPLNLYHGLPLEWTSLTGFLKDFFINGTYLHLWYLPASIFGSAISWTLIRAFKIRGAVIIAALFYMIGLFGDSYYGFSEHIPALKAFYQGVFSISFQTRNGLFFAPVFILLGALSANRPIMNTKKSLTGFAVCMALMITEGLILRGMKEQRHDSMYVMLVPCMVFLFRSLLSWNTRGTVRQRQYSLIIYLVHPWVIVLSLKISAITQLPWLFQHSLIRYLLVAAGSMLAAELWFGLSERIKVHGTSAQVCPNRAWAEINLSHLAHNTRVLQSALGSNKRIMAVVKANAYGHGDVAVAKALSREGIRAFAVATIDEGIRLRQHGITGEILILGYTDTGHAAELLRYDLTQTIVDAGHAQALSRCGVLVKVHIKVDTGMHRLGESHNHADEIIRMFNDKHLKIDGIYTHLCCADSLEREDEAFTRLQISRFNELLQKLEQHQIPLPKTHIQSSYGVLNYPEACADYARIGLALYCALGSTKQVINLKPVLSLKARVIHVNRIAAGESVGYGREFVTQKESLAATLAVGYADGVPRGLSGQGEVLLHGCRTPMIGRICMDQMTVDVTDVPNVRRGDIATLIGCDGNEELSAMEVAERAGTIANDLLSRLGSRLERVEIE